MVSGLQTKLDRDVYHVVVKLMRDNEDRPFKGVHDAYEALKNSNSSLSRQKKRPLQDSLDRVLLVLRSEAEDDDDDGEIDIDIDIATPETKDDERDERDLINRQIIKRWGIEPANMRPKSTAAKSTAAAAPAAAAAAKTNGDHPTKKKRKAAPESEDEALTAVTTPKEAQNNDSKMPDGLKALKKTSRPALYTVEAGITPPRLGGLGSWYLALRSQVERWLIEHEIHQTNSLHRVYGITLSGPPGVGKRSIIRRLASELEVGIVNLTRCFTEPERMEKSIMEAFDAALAAAPCIICIENLDRYLGRPGESNQEHQTRALSIFQLQMERIKTPDSGVLVMATTARATDISPDIVRFGMFGQEVQVRIPDSDARLSILQTITEDIRLSAEVILADLAKKMHGFVGDDIALLVQHATELAAERFAVLKYSRSNPNPDSMVVADDVMPNNEFSVTLEDFQLSMKSFVPSLRKEGFTVMPDVSWDQVGGLAEVRNRLHTSIIGPIRHPERYQAFGLHLPAGCLLWGPPGCGKTLVAQAVANEAQASFILVNGPELLNKYVGESERAVRELFKRARSSAPCIIFFDEMDSIVPRRDNTSTDAGVRVVNTLLTELDGAQGREGVFVIGTTNRPDMIDAAMLRPGRLSVLLFLDLPTAEERLDILRTIYRTRHPNAVEAEYARLPAVALDGRCRDFSGADLAGLHTRAAEFAVERFLQSGADETMAKEICPEDWEQALAEARRSVLNPETYRKLNAKLAKEGP